MQAVTGVVRNGRLELNDPIAWPDGTTVEITATAVQGSVVSPSTKFTSWPAGFLDEIRAAWGDEPFERPPQGEFEIREDW